jgi:imidazolonepropionase-like amidohydrolase
VIWCLVADRVFTARSDAAEEGLIVTVEDGVIARVDRTEPPEGARILRLRGTTLLPGLIDSHTHVSIVPSRGNQIEQMKLPVVEQLATARVNVQSDLLSNVTTMRIMGQEMDVDFLLRDEILDGRTLGPDLICAGVQIAKKGAWSCHGGRE